MSPLGRRQPLVQLLLLPAHHSRGWDTTDASAPMRLDEEPALSRRIHSNGRLLKAQTLPALFCRGLQN